MAGLNLSAPQTTERVYLNHQPRSVALVAMGPSITDFIQDTLTQELKPGWVDEVWAINMAANGIHHDVVFWMDDLVSQNEFRPGLMQLLNQRGKPVITSVRHPEIVPNSYDYPVQEVTQLGWQVFGKPYLNNGVVMAVAYALWKGVKTLRIYGADFTYPNRNYAEAGRACIESWIVFCTLQGMQVKISGTSSLFDAYGNMQGVYGFREQPEFVMPDGTRCKFIKSAEHPMPLNYVPEDSSGIHPDGQAEPMAAVVG